MDNKNDFERDIIAKVEGIASRKVINRVAFTLANSKSFFSNILSIHDEFAAIYSLTEISVKYDNILFAVSNSDYGDSTISD